MGIVRVAVDTGQVVATAKAAMERNHQGVGRNTSSSSLGPSTCSTRKECCAVGGAGVSASFALLEDSFTRHRLGGGMPASRAAVGVGVGVGVRVVVGERKCEEAMGAAVAALAARVASSLSRSLYLPLLLSLLLPQLLLQLLLLPSLLGASQRTLRLELLYGSVIELSCGPDRKFDLFAERHVFSRCR